MPRNRRPKRSSAPPGHFKLPNGRGLTRYSHDYKRHGTTALFAAFEQEGRRFAGNTFHHAPITAQGIDVVEELRTSGD
jgi:hypothetical protein